MSDLQEKVYTCAEATIIINCAKKEERERIFAALLSDKVVKYVANSVILGEDEHENDICLSVEEARAALTAAIAHIKGEE